MSGLAYMNDESCRPSGVTQGQIAAVVVQYIDARPARLNEDFRELAPKGNEVGLAVQEIDQ